MAHDWCRISSGHGRGRTPASVGGGALHPVSHSHAGTTYEIHQVGGRPGIVDDSTEVRAQLSRTPTCRTAPSTSPSKTSALGKQIKLIRELVQLRSNIRTSTAISASIRRAASSFMGRPAPARLTSPAPSANEVDARLYYINGPDVIGTYTGETEANLRRMFNEPGTIRLDHLHRRTRRDGAQARRDRRAFRHPTVTQLLALIGRASASTP